MNLFSSPKGSKWVVATPGHCSFDEDKARVLAKENQLRFLAKATRRGATDVPAELTRLNPRIGFIFTAAAMTLKGYRAESVRFRLNPWFDHWVKKQLTPGDNIISSFGYANESFKWVRKNGGKTFLSAGNSHPENFWNIISEEHRRWKCSDPPVDPKHSKRGREMLLETDYIFSPSSFVTNSFLERGFKREQILHDIYTVNLTHFTPRQMPRPKDQPLRIVSTGGLSLRKGAPYMLEAFRMIHRLHPSARFLLTTHIQDSAKPILANYADLPIEWSPGLRHPELAERLRSADIFVLPSLEEGLVRTALEAMACGLPVILTPNTGTADFVQPGVNGEVVPIRDARAIADAILKWAEIVQRAEAPPLRSFDAEQLSFAAFERNFMGQLRERGLVAAK